ncbi:cysteine proteinase [Dentipellis sp. KUC8613]|nr:cysteine proteinase [Dentipellis sp. KUC8613]
MSIPESLAHFVAALAADPVVQQLVPLIVVLVVPLLVFASRSQIHSLLWSISLLVPSLEAMLPWNWYNGHQPSEKHKGKKKHVRTRADQLARKVAAQEEKVEGEVDDDVAYYPGLVNVSGTYCFMDSTVQALASLSYLQPYLDAVHDKAETFDVPTPIIDAVRDILQTLNSPKGSPSSIRPTDLIFALSNHEPGKKSPLFSSREHQDAQELFQLVSECIKREALSVDQDARRDRGFGDLSQALAEDARELSTRGVFDGLTANRRSCVECGYTEAVMHFSFDSWQLSVPRLAASCRLEDCLADYTRLEMLTDCICRKCSVVATFDKLQQEADRLTEVTNGDANASSSKKRRAREARKLATRVKAALDEGRLEEDIKDVKLERVFSKVSTKQAMIARPPPVLVLHLNRSMHIGGYASKNSLRVAFPEFLDLTPFTTSGKLSTVPSVPISSPPPPIPRSTTPTPATLETQRVLYRLSAVVSHYGQHSFGHYICYRRKPRPPSAGARRFAPPRIPHFLECECEKCLKYGPVRDGDDEAALARDRPRAGRGWLRISDDAVSECGIESVLGEGSGAFMLYYERIVQPRPHLPSPRSSSETLKPPLGLADGSGAVVLAPDNVDGHGRVAEKFGPRIVRSVAAGRGRSSSRSAANDVRGVSAPSTPAPAPELDGRLADSVSSLAAVNGLVEGPLDPPQTTDSRGAAPAPVGRAPSPPALLAPVPSAAPSVARHASASTQVRPQALETLASPTPMAVDLRA